MNASSSKLRFENFIELFFEKSVSSLILYDVRFFFDLLFCLFDFNEDYSGILKSTLNQVFSKIAFPVTETKPELPVTAPASESKSETPR